LPGKTPGPPAFWSRTPEKGRDRGRERAGKGEEGKEEKKGGEASTPGLRPPKL